MSDADRDATARSREDARAIAWLHEVDGRLMRKREAADAPDGWVAIVRTPPTPGHTGRLILGFGESASRAVETARDAWVKAALETRTVH